jgi:SAM-dependent methyltransferase
LTQHNEAEAQLYNHTAQSLNVHETLLADEARNRAFYRALESAVSNDSAVLDIGSGTGIWAIIAAKLGARRVVAIERDELLIGLIRTLAQANGVADRVEVIRGDFPQVQLEREFDLVISETIGNVIFEEQIVPIMVDARERFLKPGGSMIPQRVALLVAPAYLESRYSRLPMGINASFEQLESLILNSPVALIEDSRLKFVGEPQTLIEVDLTSLASPLDLTSLKASWNDVNTAQINCFAVWADLVLTPGVTISTLETTSWSTMAYRVKPFGEQHGNLEFKLSLTRESNYWTTILARDKYQEVHSYSPALAARELLLRTRTDPDVFSHLKRLGLIEPAPNHT